MTMGTILNYGEVGDNVGAFMLGGVYYQYDPNEELVSKIPKTLDIHSLDADEAKRA